MLNPRFLDLRMCSVKFLKEVFCLSIPLKGELCRYCADLFYCC